MIDKESILALQKIDCNCNDCGHMQRDMDKYRSFDDLYTNERGQVTTPSHRVQYGDCVKFNEPVSFIPGLCQLDTQDCFEHRKEMKLQPQQ